MFAPAVTPSVLGCMHHKAMRTQGAKPLSMHRDLRKKMRIRGAKPRSVHCKHHKVVDMLTRRVFIVDYCIDR